MPVHFFSEDIEFSLSEKVTVTEWLSEIISSHQYKLEELNYIFCNDHYLHGINKQYLDHDTLTDIITFDNSDKQGTIEADIFVSIERVKENAFTYSKSFDLELYRVLVHGLLHLLGFKDKSNDEILEMRKNEEACLSLLIERL